MDELIPCGMLCPLERPQESIPRKLSFDLAAGGTITLPMLLHDNESFCSP